MTTVREVSVATREQFVLGEGPRWDVSRNRLLWVDIQAARVMAGHLDGTRVTVDQTWPIGTLAEKQLSLPTPTVGAVAVVSDGSLLVAGAKHLVFVRPDGQVELGPHLIEDGCERRLNDCAVDPAGRLLAGTLNLAGASSDEVLMRLEADDGLTVLDADLTMSNGLAWSADGALLYSADTLRRVIRVRRYDSDGTSGPRRVHIRLDDGYPDGIAVDESNHLWVAVWGKGEVRRYAPDGTPTERVIVPAPHTSAVAFAGEDLRTLVMTTALSELNSEQRQTFPDSGRLFTVRVDVPGLPTTPCRWPAAAAKQETNIPCT